MSSLSPTMAHISDEDATSTIARLRQDKVKPKITYTVREIQQPCTVAAHITLEDDANRVATRAYKLAMRSKRWNQHPPTTTVEPANGGGFLLIFEGTITKYEPSKPECAERVLMAMKQEGVIPVCPPSVTKHDPIIIGTKQRERSAR